MPRKMNKETSTTTKTKEKTGNYPKRNKSAYLFFCEAKRQEIKNAHPDLKLGAISKKLAAMWNKLNAQDKKVYFFLIIFY